METPTIDPATGKPLSMTNVAVSGEVIPPGSLLDLVARVNHEHKQVKECVIKGVRA